MTIDRWQYAEDLTKIALDLVTAVRDEEPVRVHRELARLRDQGHLEPLVVVLAAMVPDDLPASELLAWTDPLAPPLTCDPELDGSPPGTTSEHGSRSRYTAGCRGAACLAADYAYRDQRRPANVAGDEGRVAS